MGERYSRLFTLPQSLYAAGASVVIAAGALLKDHQTGRVLAQLKMQNIGDKAIKAVTVSILPQDTVGKQLGEAVRYQYLDLDAIRDVEFGSKVPIILPDAATRAFSASVSQVIFADNTIWTADNTSWEPLSNPVPLEEVLVDKELVKQYKIQFGEPCRYMVQKERDLWRCTCGRWNHSQELRCHQCGNSLEELQTVDPKQLQLMRDARVAEEQQTEQKEQGQRKFRTVSRVAGVCLLLPSAGLLLWKNGYLLQNRLYAPEYTMLVDALIGIAVLGCVWLILGAVNRVSRRIAYGVSLVNLLWGLYFVYVFAVALRAGPVAGVVLLLILLAAGGLLWWALKGLKKD